MEGSFPLFTLLGFKVKVHPSWLIVLVLLTWSLAVGLFPQIVPDQSTTAYWAMGLAGAIGLFVCIILHEFGHAVVARRFGIQIKGISLFIFGGVAEMETEPPTARSELYMAVAGPAVSVALAAGFWLAALLASAAGWPETAVGVLQYLGLINGILVLFNLIPAFPLDGGRVLRAILWQRKKNLRGATRTASRIGSGFGVFLIVLGLFSLLTGNLIGGIWWALIGLFLRSASQSSFRQLEIRQALEGEPIRRFMNEDPVTVSPATSIQDLVDDYIYRHHLEMFPVVEDSRLLGCASIEQVKRQPREEWSQRTVREIQTECSADNSVQTNADAVDVLALMRRTNQSQVLVLDGDRLAGVITLRDLLGFLALKLDLEGESPMTLREAGGSALG